MMHKLLWILTFVLFFAMQGNTQTCDLVNENFDTNGGNVPAGWQQNGSYINSGSAYSNTIKAGFNTLNDNLILPAFTCPGEICFYWRASGGSSDFDMDIDYSEDNGGTWITAHTIALNGTSSPTTYNQTCVTLPTGDFTAPYTNILLRFNQSRRNSGSFYLDDVCVSTGACVITPTQLTFSNLQAGCLQANTPFSVNVCATDAAGNVDNTYNSTINVSQASGSGSLSGTLGQIPTNGCVTFTDLSFSTADTYTLSAAGSGLTGTSDNIQIVGTCPSVNTLKVMTYNLLQYPNSSNICGNPVVIPNRTDSLAVITTYVEPDVLMVCELQTEAGANLILNNALNINGLTKYAQATWKINGSPGGTSLNNGFFYNTDKLTFYAQSEIPTDVRDINVYTLYANDPNLSTHQDTVFMDFYVAHLKAGNSAAEAEKRKIECQAIQNHINAQSSDHNAIIGGDFNVYNSNEEGYQLLLGGSYPFYDPINAPGSWNNSSAYAGIHTQSTRASGDAPYDCGATGGVDDRFDFLLASNSVMNGLDHVQYIANSYTNLGNNGSTFNKAINSPDNTVNVPRNVLSALYYMSDHLPILMDVEVTLPLVLPVELTHFTTTVTTDKTVKLDWRGVESNVADYEIERSIDGRIFEKIATQIAGENDYKYIDSDLPAGSTFLYYRLKMNDLDGYYEYSKINSVHLPTTNWSVNAFPNPNNGIFSITFSETSTGMANVQLFNPLGQLIYQKQTDTNAQLDINLDTPNSGMFWLVVENEGTYIRKAILVN